MSHIFASFVRAQLRRRLGASYDWDGAELYYDGDPVSYRMLQTEETALAEALSLASRLMPYVQPNP